MLRKQKRNVQKSLKTISTGSLAHALSNFAGKECPQHFSYIIIIHHHHHRHHNQISFNHVISSGFRGDGKGVGRAIVTKKTHRLFF